MTNTKTTRDDLPMTQPGRTLVTFAVDDDMHRDLTIAATATNRSIAEEVETRLIALRLIEESLRILKRRDVGQKIQEDQRDTGS